MATIYDNPNYHFLTLFLLTSLGIAQDKKVLQITKTDIPPKIDGILDDEAWINAGEATDFVQFAPDMGVVDKDHQRTVVKMVYNDKAIFISAYLHDRPENMMRQFTSRDNFGQSDFFGVIFNTNNDGQNDLEFLSKVPGPKVMPLPRPILVRISDGTPSGKVP